MPPAEKSLRLPVKPFAISDNNVFGANAAYYVKFLDAFGNPEKGHSGIDMRASHGLPVYAAHDGEAIYIKDEHGGEVIWNFANGFATINCT